MCNLGPKYVPVYRDNAKLVGSPVAKHSLQGNLQHTQTYGVHATPGRRWHATARVRRNEDFAVAFLFALRL